MSDTRPMPFHRGSSPRMRGTPQPACTSRQQGGIIPAYAGNTVPRLGPLAAWRDHPRVCGEHQPIGRKFHPITGSSPRMRGTRNLAGECDGDIGIIPAYAGNTGNTHTSTQQDRDHPRVCGEHLYPSSSAVFIAGSSPRMRGTPISKVSVSRSGGIIPAYAGNTNSGSPSYAVCGDHPRVCGEHHRQGRVVELHEGSSPRMRGTHAGWGPITQSPGIIPAYAGNTCRIRSPPPHQRDHPRVCGEH